MPHVRTARARTLALALGALAAVLLAALALTRGSAPPAIQSGGIQVGFVRVSRPAPAFDLPRLSGAGMIRAGQLHGRPVVINFWSSTCVICQQESPAIARVARATRADVYYLGIDTLDSRGSAEAFARHYGLSYPIAADPQGVAAARYGVPGLPVTYFLAASGKKIIGVNAGALTVRGLTAILRQLYGPAILR